MREALSKSFVGEREFFEKQQQKLNTQRKKLQNLIDHAYEDKVDGLLDVDEWKSKTNKWKEEQFAIDSQLARSQHLNQDSLLKGISTLELAQKAPTLYKSMTMQEKRELINIVLSNPNLVEGKLQFNWRKPFDILAKMRDTNEWQAR